MIRIAGTKKVVHMGSGVDLFFFDCPSSQYAVNICRTLRQIPPQAFHFHQTQGFEKSAKLIDVIFCNDFEMIFVRPPTLHIGPVFIQKKNT